MGKFREFWLSESEIERLNLDGKPHKNDGYFVHVIELQAFTEAVELIDELEKFIEPQAKNMAETRYESGVHLGGESLAEQALAKIREFKEKGE